PRRDERTERRESVRALALEALPAAIELKVTLGEIDADAVAEHVVERLALRDVDARPAEIVGRAAQCAGRFQEQSRLLRQRQAGFFRVIAVVQANADDFTDAAQRRTEYRALLYFDESLCRHGGNGFDVVQGRRARIERGKTARQVEDFTIQNEAGLLAGRGSVTDKLHALYNIRGSCKTASHYQ